ncbi:LANO_0E02498g1_1 [Lachancea nothofagi CBS 11611]|uniref:LANO_0E02498g1_1 n=1 Tax=Lachancea nothofagi CBS 11611 TaxID=1266666 RepID=A0A1G4JQJ8_9SACH|nr:LANO_0E02498g1_1 [Lachancea nothofagi CBS 11611]
MSVILSSDSALIELSQGHESAVLACKLLNSGSTVVSSGLDPHICIWDLNNSKSYLIDNIYRQGSAITTLDIIDGPKIITGSSNSQVALVDIETGQKLRNYTGHQRAVNQLRTISQDRFISVADDGAVKAWDSHQKKPVWEVSTEFPLFTVAVSPQQEHTVYVSGLDPVITAYDIRQSNGQVLFSWDTNHVEPITSIDITSNYKMCSMAFDNEIHIADAKLRSTRDSRDLGIIDTCNDENVSKFLIRNKFINEGQFVVSQGLMFDATTKERVIDFKSNAISDANFIDMDYDLKSKKVLMGSETGNLYVYQM